MPCGCSDKLDNKKLDLEEMKNMSIEEITRLYQQGYRLENEQLSISNLQHINFNSQSLENIYNMAPDPVTIIYTQSYTQSDGRMTADFLIRNPNPTSLVIRIDIYDYYGSPPPLLGTQIACIIPYSQNGCTKVRVQNLVWKDPARAYILRCVDTPICGTPSCVRFDTTNIESSCAISMVRYDGTIPPLSDFPPTGVSKCSGGTLNIAVDCASCTPSWSCILDAQNRNTGYKYDSCTQQTVQDLTMCPLPTVPGSTISISADKVSPFDKGAVVTFSGALRSATTNVNIVGAQLHYTIRVGTANVDSGYVTTTSTAYPGNNWSHPWTVPSSIAGVDTAGMSITVTVEFAGTAGYLASTQTATYAVAGFACNNIALSVSRYEATVGDTIALTAVTNPPGHSYPVRFKANGLNVMLVPSGQQGHCSTVVATGTTGTTDLDIYNQNSNYRVHSLQNTLTILNPPDVVVPGQILDIQVSYDVTVDWWGDWVRFKICDKSGNTLGYMGQLLFGHSIGIQIVPIKIPDNASGSLLLHAEFSLTYWNFTCGEEVLVSSTSIVVSIVQYQANKITLLTTPYSVVAGSDVDFKIAYDLTVNGFDIVRFRICTDTRELGYHQRLLYGHETSIDTVTATIPADARGWTVIRAEVSTNQDATCGQDTMARSVSHGFWVAVQGNNTISIVAIDYSLTSYASVTPGQTAKITVAYNLNILETGQRVRFRICDTATNTEIGNGIFMWAGLVSGRAEFDIKIPETVSGSITIKAEATLDTANAICGSAVYVVSSPVSIPVKPLLPGTCSIDWDTSKWYGGVETSKWPAGIYQIVGEVVGQCTSPPEIIKLNPLPVPCTSVSLGISTMQPKVGDIITLTAFASPLIEIYDVTFKSNGKAIGSNTTISGRANYRWDTTGLSAGTYKLTSNIGDKCLSYPITITLAAVVPTGSAIFVVNCDGNPCKDAIIINKQNGQAIATTLVDGKTPAISGLPEGIFNFTVTKSGFTDGSGSVGIIASQTVTANVVNITTSTAGTGTLHFEVKSEGKPLEGAKVTLTSDKLTGTTDVVNGTVDFTDLLLQSSHPYTVEKSGYNTVNASVSGTDFTTSPTNVSVDMILSSVTPAAGGGGAIMMAGIAAIGIAYYMMKKS